MNFPFTHLDAHWLHCVVVAVAAAAGCGFHADAETVLVGPELDGELVVPGWGRRWRCQRRTPSRRRTSASSGKTFSLS